MNAANSFGSLLTLTTFGESHGPAMGAVITGMPAGIPYDSEVLKTVLERRRPGQSALVTSRTESDQPEVLSGIYKDITLGTPIAVVIRNTDQRSSDYQNIAPRVAHADQAWIDKYGHVDGRGGGRASGRETVARVVGGAFAQMLLSAVEPETKVICFARQIGPFEMSQAEWTEFSERIDQATDEKQIISLIDNHSLRFPSASNIEHCSSLLKQAKEEGKSYGGTVEVWVDGLPQGLGQPVFHKLKADLASALMGIGAVVGIEFGVGFSITRKEGSELYSSLSTATLGGLRGGISTGERLIMRVAFKPTSSVARVATAGRHDPCIVPRAIPVVEAMVRLTLADHWLWAKLDRLESLKTR